MNMYHIFFTHPSVDIHMFNHILEIVNRVALNIGMYKSFGYDYYIDLMYTPRSQIIGCYGRAIICILLRNFYTILNAILNHIDTNNL